MINERSLFVNLVKTNKKTYGDAIEIANGNDVIADFFS